jgi:hypothetical protein
VEDTVLKGEMKVRVNNTGGAVDETINTGGEPVAVQFAANEGLFESVEVRGEIQLGGFFYASGTFAIEHRTMTVSLFDRSTIPPATQSLEVDLLTVGGNGIRGFVGVNGPYWNDLNGNGQVDGTDLDDDGVLEVGESDELSGAARGLEISGVDFALALASPLVAVPPPPAQVTDKRRWTALTGRVGNVRLVGVDDLTLAGTDLELEINQGSGTGDDGQDNTTVIDFAATSPQLTFLFMAAITHSFFG